MNEQELDVTLRAKRLNRRVMAFYDLIDAVRGHLDGGDWDKELREALIEVDATAPQKRESSDG